MFWKVENGNPYSWTILGRYSRGPRARAPDRSSSRCEKLWDLIVFYSSQKNNEIVSKKKEKKKRSLIKLRCLKKIIKLRFL